jgi:hypothetical protein
MADQIAHQPARSRRRAVLAVVTAGALILAGCAVGKRPSFDAVATDTAEGAMTGDVAIDAVLTRLDAVALAGFTADYTAVLSFGGTTSDVRAVQDHSAARRAVTIGGVRYLTDGQTTSTCVTATQVCTDTIDAAAVSDTGVTPDFAFGALAKRLRHDAAAKIGTATPSTVVVDGLTATCVDVPVTGGTKQYCVLDNGVITRFVGGDVTIDMVGYTSAVDATLFTGP